MKAFFCILGILSAHYAIATPTSTNHNKILNIGQIEFLDKSKANNGQKIIGTVTTPMIYNGLYTQDIGAIVLGEEYLFGTNNSVFPSNTQTLNGMDIIGYEVAAREYAKAIKNIRLFCSTDPVYRTKKKTSCRQREHGGDVCSTRTIKGATCNEHLKTFQNYLSKDYLAPDVETFQVCIANCNPPPSSTNDREDRGHDPNDSSKG